MIFKYIEPMYFFIALLVGIFCTYLVIPPSTIVEIHPTPDNAGKIIYKDNADVCYKYRAEEVSCPDDEKKIFRIPISQ